MIAPRVPFVHLSDDDRAAIRTLLHQRELTPRVRERLEMVKAADLGYDLATIAGWSGRSEKTVHHWLGRFAAYGLTGLADAPRPGRPVQADAAYLALLEQTIVTAPRALGLPFDVWTSGRLSAYLAEQTGVRLSPGWLRALLARQRFACGRPKHTLDHLQDADEVARCEAELAEAGEKGGGGAGTLRAPSPG
jgi:transposase